MTKLEIANEVGNSLFCDADDGKPAEDFGFTLPHNTAVNVTLECRSDYCSLFTSSKLDDQVMNQPNFGHKSNFGTLFGENKLFFTMRK